MNKTIGWLIAAIGGYWLLEQMNYVPCLFGCTAATPSTGTATTPQAANPNNATTAATTSSATPSAIQAAMVANHDDFTKMHTAWQWNYYYQNVRGIPGPDPNVLFPNNPYATSQEFTFDEWWSAMQGQGFSGLGLIAKNVNPYNNPMGTPFGSYLSPRGIEKFTVYPS